MAIAFGTQEYEDISNEVALLAKNNQIKNNQDLNNYLTSKDVSILDFKRAVDEEATQKTRVKSGEAYGTAADGIELFGVGVPMPTKIIDRALGNIADDITSAVGSGIELTAGKEARKNVSNFFGEAGNIIKNVIGQENTDSLKRTFDPKTNTAEQVASSFAEFALPFGIATKTLGTLGKIAKIPKATTKAQKRIRDYSKYGTAGVAADVFTRDEDEQLTMNLVQMIPGMEDSLSSLAIDPDDSFAEKKLKQSVDSLLGQIAFGGLIIGGIGVTKSGINVGGKIISKTDLVNKLKKGSSSLTNKVSAIKNSKIMTPINNSANTIVSNVKATKNSLGQYMQTGTAKNVLGKIGNINSFLGKAFTSKAGMSDPLFKANILRREYAEARDILAKKEAKDLERLIKKHNSDRNLVNKVLQGAYVSNPNNNPKIAKEVIDQAQKMNKMIQDNTPIIKSLLKLKDDDVLSLQLDANNGTYLTRTYQFSSNPQWTKQIGKVLDGKLKPNSQNNQDLINIVENARSYILKQHPSLNRDQADNILNEMLLKGKAGEQVNLFETLLYEGVGGVGKKVGVRVGKKRKNIDKPILEFLGEIKDPTKNFVTTIQNQNRLIAKAKYINDIKSIAENSLGRQVKLEGLFPSLPTEVSTFVKANIAPNKFINKKLSDLEAVKELEGLGVSSKRLGLDDIYTTPEMGTVFDRGLDVFGFEGSKNFYLNGFAKLAGIGQANQTVLDNATHVLNVYGAAQQVAMNGHFFNKQVYNNSVSALKTVLEKAKLQDPKALEELAYLKQSGLIDSSVDAEIVLKNLNLRGTSDDIVGEKSLAKKIYDVPFKGIKKTLKIASGVYGGVDDVSKLIALKAEVAQYRKAFPNLSEKEILDKSIEIVRNTMPSYSTAAPAVRLLSRVPLGTYATFPAEMVRTTKNIVSQGIRDVLEGRRTNNSALKNIGYKRLTSAAGVTTGLGVGIATYNQLNDVTPENERAVKLLSADYSKNSPKLFLENFTEDRNGNIIAKVVDSGSIDAAQYVKGPIRAIIARLTAGEEVTQRELDDVFKEIGTEVLSPYFSPKFLTKDLVSLISGFDEKGNEVSKAEAVKNLATTLIYPGFAENIQAYIQAKKSEELMGKGEAVNQYGFPTSSEDQSTFNKFGIRKQTINLNKQLGYSIFQDLKEIRETKKSLSNLLNRETPIKVLDLDEKKDIINKYLKLQLDKKERQARLYDKIKVFGDITYTDKENNKQTLTASGIIKLLSNQGLSKADKTTMSSAIKNGRFVPDTLSVKEMQRLIQTKKFPTDVLRSIVEYSKQLEGIKLRDY